MIIIRPATYADVEDVMDRISEISADEMVRCGVDSAWKGLGRAKMCKDKGYLDVGVRDGVPQCVFGGVRDGHVMRTWFIAAKEYFEGGLPVIRASRRHMARVAKLYPNFSIEAASLSQHPDVTRWFETMGFEVTQKAGDATLFRYKSTNSTAGSNSANFLD